MGCPRYRALSSIDLLASGTDPPQPLIDEDPALYEEALQLFVGREEYDFNMMGLGMLQSRDALLAAARKLDRAEDVKRILAAVVPSRG